jgi:hypothetical protein
MFLLFRIPRVAGVAVSDWIAASVAHSSGEGRKIRSGLHHKKLLYPLSFEQLEQLLFLLETGNSQLESGYYHNLPLTVSLQPFIASFSPLQFQVSLKPLSSL